LFACNVRSLTGCEPPSTPRNPRERPTLAVNANSCRLIDAPSVSAIAFAWLSSVWDASDEAA
jgi:hypothetical protein